MKLFWKQFTYMLSIVMITFGIFGSVLLYSSFQMTMKGEKSRIVDDISMFQYGILSSLQGLSSDYEAWDYVVAKIGESIIDSMGTKQDIVRIYREDKDLIYESRKEKKEVTSVEDNILYGSLKENNINAISKVVKEGDNYYLQSLSILDTEKGNYYLELNRDITFIYENRHYLFRQYQLILVVVILLSILLSLVFSLKLTKSIGILSKEARNFANGNYERRIQVTGNDEVAQLMCDFNQMADQLEKTMKQLQEEARKQEEFSAAFAHELKTPLTSIIGYGDMLRMMDLSEEERRMCGEYIFSQGQRLEKLSHKMLELVGMEHEKMEFRKIPVEYLMNKTYPIVQKQLEDKKIQFCMQAEPGVVFGEEDLLLSLFTNLIDNSRKACQEGGKILCKGEQTEDGYCFILVDDGRGISKEDLDKIKEAFYMVDKSRSRKEGGVGLGMALCEKIILCHNATWKIQSKPGVGTQISILFPKQLNRQEVEVE